MRTRLALVVVVSTVAFAGVGCSEKARPDGAGGPGPVASAAAATEAAPIVPITATAAVTAADGSTTRTWNGDHFDVTVKAPACKAKAACTADIQVTAKPGFHINEDYPYRFNAKAAPGVAFKGKDDKTPDVFSKAAGDFTKASAQNGSLSVRYEADGSAKKIPLSGLFKMSVCSDAACQIETPTLDVEVPLAG